jgi:MazG family protein
MQPPDSTLPPLEQLRQVMAQLRGPGGCPWDHEQTHASLRGGLLEEAYEVAAALDANDDANLREELGDLLLQVVFHAQIGAEENRFTLDDIARGIVEKLIRRHPHVYATESAKDSGAVLQRWDEIKRAEKANAGAGEPAGPLSLLDGLTPGLPALLHAEKVQKKAAKVGFDWPNAAPVFEKIQEELRELQEAIATGERREIEGELGDLLFSVVNLARKLRVEPEVALSTSTAKFIHRFRAIETLAYERNLSFATMGLEALDQLWAEVKQRER